MFHASRRRSAHWLASAAIIALAFDTAQAQEAPDGAESGSADIIVTAQRRAERLQDVPISVTALGAEALAESGIVSSKELPMAVPGLRVETTGAYVQPTIRGISTSVLGPTAETNIATYIDGVYQTSQAAAIYELPDVDRIEVLKGPQGTLFGRNATGGAIIINTLKPDLDKATGMVSAGYGRFNDMTLKGHVSAPLVQDKLAVGLSGVYENRDGYRIDLLNNRRHVGDVKSLLLRGKIRFLPWEGADFTLTGLYSDRDDFDSVRNTNYNGNNAAARKLPASQIASQPWESSVNEIP